MRPIGHVPAHPARRRFPAVVAAVVVAASGAAVAPAWAAVDAERVVTLVGDLQSELGCPGDWQPDCAATRLAVQEDGTWAADFVVPEGEWQYKVAFDGAWDESYPGDNLPLALAGDAGVRFTYGDDVEEPRLRLTPLTLEGGYTEADDALAHSPVRQAGSDERFYFVLTDRFANGDESNDTAGIEGDRLDHGFDPTDKGFYHGGDLRGLIDRLDYIAGLGTTAVWLTPSFKNMPVQGAGTDDVSAGYHGYWITDFTQIDPHLGTNAELRELIAEAEARGMKIYFDIITNHTADVIQYEPAEFDYVFKADEPYRTADGTPFDPAELAGTGEFPDLDPEVSFPRVPVVADELADVKAPAWLNDTTLYHNRGSIGGSQWDDPEASTYGDFFGLDDLMTEHPDVVDGFVDVYKYWIDQGVAGFRIDTVKHVNFEFWEEWSSRVIDHALEQGRDDFFMFGEVYSSDPDVLAPYVRDTDMSSVLDFAFQEHVTGYARGLNAGQLSRLFANDDVFVTPTTSPYALPTFLGNHDMGRVGRFVGGDEAFERARMAHELMYVSRGQPVVYYGDEQGFVGAGGDKDARQSLFATQVEQFADETLLTGERAGSVDRYDTDAPMYERLAELAALRDAHPALAQGAQVERLAEDNLYAFSRVDTREQPAGVETIVPTRLVRDLTVRPEVPVCVDVAGTEGVPQDATGVMVNVTSVRPDGLGHAVVYPRTGDGTAPTTGSTVNFERDKDVANASFVALGDDGGLCYLTRGARQSGLIIDVTGFTREGSGVQMQTPERVLDTRPAPFRAGDVSGPVRPRTPYTVQIAGVGDVPADATSALLNVTVTGARALGNLRVYPGPDDIPLTSTVNYAPGTDKANATVVQLSEDGTISFWSDTDASVAASSVHVVIDVLGWTTADSDLTGLLPRRIVDSRPGMENRGITGPLQPRTAYPVRVAGRAGVPADASAVVLNVTAIGPDTLGHLRVYPGPDGADTPVPDVSTVNYVAGRDLPNLVVVDLPENGTVNFWSEQEARGSVHLAVDVVGYVRGPQTSPEYVVVANNGSEADTATFTTLTPGARYTGLLGTTETVTADAEGATSVTVPARSVVVLQGDRPVAAAGELQVSVAVPQPGAALRAGRVAVRAETVQDRYHETSISFRLVGTAEWTHVGTSDNGNDRVFHDLPALPRGTLVEYRAVTVDVAGDAAAASTFASVGVAVQPVEDEGEEPPLTLDPELVTIPGTHGPQLGCTGTDGWDPACTAFALEKVEGHEGLWARTFELAAGDYSYKTVVDAHESGWEINFGADGVLDGGNIGYTHAGGEITYYFDARNGWAWNSAMTPPITITGAFQAALGCPGDWDPSCLATRMTVDGAVATFTADVPAGTHEFKVVYGLRWPEAPGARDFGAPGGGNFSHDFTGGPVTFTWDIASETLTVTADG